MLPGGGTQWLVRYRTPDGKRSKVIIGVYADLSVAHAHAKAAEVHLAARTDAPIVGVRAQARARAASLTEAEQAAKAAAEEARRYSFTVLGEAWLESCRPG